MTCPPVTDELPVAIRAYAVPTFREWRDPPKTPPKAKRRPAPASPISLVFDAETTTDVGQSLRFGTYQLRYGQELTEAGIFYAPDSITADELAVLRTFADANGYVLRTRNEFADEVFYAKAYTPRATIIGFNLPFDISRLAISHASAKTPRDGHASAMHGGFTFKLSSQKIYPNIRVKHMSKTAALIAFAAPMGQRDGRGLRNRGLHIGVRRGHFIDVKTLSKALFAKGFTLGSLSKFLEIPNPKLDFDDYDGPITEHMTRYAMRDTQATWECYSELISRFGALNLHETKPEKIYSEASIGKGYIREMGISPWAKVQPNPPADLVAKIMGSYFGGRSEVRIRREVRQVMLCDFLSMYPTVCTLMGLWRFVIADGMTWHDATQSTRDWLSSVDLAAIQSQDTWLQLATLVRVRPDADIFPVRAAYLGEAQSTIGANYLSSDTPLWFTLADCVAAKLLTGKTPEIVEAISFAPGSPQAGLRPIDIAGNPEYRVDPLQTDFFKRVIEVRQAVKMRMAAATGDERTRLDTEQNALKICANSTSYGIWVEVNVETRSARKSVTVCNSTGSRFTFPTDKAEMPGTYFHPLLATLITGAARLMLATAERLASDAGLDWSFCDTDSMAFARPKAMDPESFEAHCKRIVDWFAALNPYNFGGSILKIEDVNSGLKTGKPEPLFCFAISSKRYALFNIASDGQPIMRKVSAHGLGHLSAPYCEADAPEQFPKPDNSVLRDGTVRWHCDLWHQIVSAALAGHPDQVALNYHPALSRPAISRYSANSPDLLAWFKTYNRGLPYQMQVKPFGFMHSFSSAIALGSAAKIGSCAKGRRKQPKPIKPIAPFDSDHRKSVAMAFDRETGVKVRPSQLRSYADALFQYHISPESKFLNADYLDRGTTLRRHVRMSSVRHIGKESHDWERQAVIGLNAASNISYGTEAAEIAEKLKSFVAAFGERLAAKALGISRTQLAGVGSIQSVPGQSKLIADISVRLPSALKRCAQDRAEQQAELEELRLSAAKDGLRSTARRLGIDASNLRRRLKGIRDLA